MRLAGLIAVALAFALAPGVASAQVKIVIDAGHGGTDPGGVGTGMQEKNVVLDVSKRFKALLEADTADDAGGGKWTALMTRNTDVFVSLAGRSQYSNSNDADRFMCIHSNAFGDASANGTETFSYATTGMGSQLRNLVQEEMLTAWGLTNRGNKTANFAVLRDTAAPAILHELAFITNATDAVKLGSDTERQKAAVAHLRALQRHYNLAPYEPGMPTTTGEGGDIAGQVLDINGPVLGAKVELEGGAAVVTDSQGRFMISDAPAGSHMITASAEGHATKVVEVTVASAALQLTIDLALDGTGSGSGSDDDLDGDAIASCSTAGSSSLLVVVALFGLVGRRRKARHR
jgi:N-acetylmuramoyl-L-alanine amidase